MTYTNTELFNKILEAMDNYKPVYIVTDSGASQSFVSNMAWLGPYIVLLLSSPNSGEEITIYPVSGDTLYVPTNISPIQSPSPVTPVTPVTPVNPGDGGIK